MSIRRIIVCLLTLALVPSLGCSAGSKAQPLATAPELVGAWVDNAGGTWEFKSDATLVVNGKPVGRWTSPQAGRLSVTYGNGKPIESRYEMVGGQVKLWDSLRADAKFLMLTKK